MFYPSSERADTLQKATETLVTFAVIFELFVWLTPKVFEVMVRLAFSG